MTVLNGEALELHRSAAPLTNDIRDAQRKAKTRLLYEPALSSVACGFMARVMSGKASTGDTEDRPANEFLHDKPENEELVKRLLRAGNSEHYDPQQFVDAADDNYALRQGYTHMSDAWLKQTAADLRTVGALDFFRETHPVQCMIVEHMDAMLSVL